MDPKQQGALRAPGPFSMRMGSPLEAGVAPGALRSVHALSSDHTNAPSSAPPEARDPLTDLVTKLTPRRFEVLELVARGLTNREIAAVMGISANTVKAHVTGVLETLELSNRTEAAVALQGYEAERSADRPLA